MKIDMILVFSIVVALVTIPYVLFIVFGFGNGKKGTSKLKEEALKNALQLNSTEKWASREIAIDTTKKHLLFAKTVGEEMFFEHVDLNAISKVTLLAENTGKKLSGQLHTNLEMLSLQLFYKGSEASVVLNFYDSLTDSSQNYEMNRAQKWKEIIEKILIENAPVVQANRAA